MSIFLQIHFTKFILFFFCCSMQHHRRLSAWWQKLMLFTVIWVAWNSSSPFYLLYAFAVRRYFLIQRTMIPKNNSWPNPNSSTHLEKIVSIWGTRERSQGKYEKDLILTTRQAEKRCETAYLLSYPGSMARLFADKI